MKQLRRQNTGMGRLRYGAFLLRCFAAALCLAALSPGPAPAAEVPLKFTYQGNMRQGGFLANGRRHLVFRIYGSSFAASGSELWTSPEYEVEVSTGVFQATLEPSLAAWQGGGLWLELQVENERLTPREEITASPYAINSALHSGRQYVSSGTAPSSPDKGDLWMNTSLNSLYFWNGSAWTSTAGSGAAHAPSHAGGAVDALTSLGAHSVTGDLTVNGGVSLRSAGEGVRISTHLVVTGALNPSSNLSIGGAGYAVSFSSTVRAGVYGGSRLHLAGAPSYSGDMLTVSDGAADVVRMTGAGDVHAVRLYGDGSALTGVSGSGGSSYDNLGNHTATTHLKMGVHQVTGSGSVTMSSFTATGAGVRAAQWRLAEGVALALESSGALGGGLRVSSNVYTVGFTSATKYYGDGSALTGITGAGGADDNLGNHTATADLRLGSHQLTGAGSVTMASFTATGAGISAPQLRLADAVLVSSESSGALGAGVRVSSNIYTAGFVSAAKFYGDGSSLTGLTALADNLGDHTALTDLRTGGYQVTGAGAATMSSFTATGDGFGAAQWRLSAAVAVSSESLGALGGGLRVSSSVYIVGFSSATKYYGDGSALTGLVALSDSLGDHTATADLKMGAHQVTGSGSATMSSFTATGDGFGAAQWRLADGVAVSSETSGELGGGLRVSSNVYIVGFSSAARYYGDGSALTGVGGFDDNLGDHTATTDLLMGPYQLTGAGPVTMSSFTATGAGFGAARLSLADGVAVSSEASGALGGGLRVSSNVYIVGFSSAARYYGDGSALTGLVALSDNLGDHTATTDLLMGAHQVTGSGAATLSSFTATGEGFSAAQLNLNPGVVLAPEASAELGRGVRVSSNIYVVGFASATSYYGDGSSLTGLNALSDSLGDHTALTNLKMGVYQVTGAGAVTLSSFTATGAGFSAAQLRLADAVLVSSESSGALGAGVRVSTNVYIAGVSSATRYFGDGSTLSGLDAMYDNLGDHTAEVNLNLNSYNILDAGGLNVLGGSGLRLNGLAETGKYLRGDGTRFVPAYLQSADLPVTPAVPYVRDTGDFMTGRLTIAGATLTVTGAEGVWAPKHSFAEGISLSYTSEGNTGIYVNSPLYTPGLLVSPYGELQSRGVGRGFSVGNTRGAGAVDLQVRRIAASGAATGPYAVVSGGQENGAAGDSAVVSGGSQNTASGPYALVGGGQSNVASGNSAMVPGGLSNTASGGYSFAAGRSNAASADYSFAAGVYAQSAAAGAFTWGDSQRVLIGNSLADRVRFKARGGFLVSGSTASAADMTGTVNRGLLVTGSGLVGIGHPNPQGAIDVAAVGDTDDYKVAVWRNASGTDLAHLSATGILTAAKFVGDSSSLSGIAKRVFQTVALSGALNDHVDIGSFDSSSGIHSFYISATVIAPVTGFSVARQYAVPISNNMTGGAWRVVLPLADTGPYGGNDFILEVNVTGTSAKFRLRRTSGATPATVALNIEQLGPSDDVFTAGTQTGNDTFQYPALPVTVITQTGGLAGAGTAAPRSRFDVLDGSITVRGENAGLVLENASRVITAETAAGLGAGLRVSTNVYIVGVASVTKYYGDGSTLAGAYDDLGNHVATNTLNMSGLAIMNVSSASFNGANVAGADPLFLVGGATLAVRNNGYVGIGQLTPLTLLHLQAGITLPFLGEAAGVGRLRLDNGSASLGESGGIEFKTTGAAGGSGSKIQALNSGGSQLVFAGRQSAGAWTEQLRIDAGGNVGIGRPSAGSRLDVYSAGSTFVSVAGAGNSGYVLTNNTGGQTWTVYEENGGSYRIDRAGGGGEFTVDTAGKTGIGVTSPSTKLEVNGAVTARAESGASMAFRAAGRSGDDFAWAPIAFENDGTTPAGGMTYTPAGVTLRAGSGLTPVMTWLVSGNAGIGTAVPAAKLEVAGTDAVKVPVGTSAERPGPAVNGMVRLNTTTGKLEYCSNGWVDVSGNRYYTPHTVTDIGGYRIHTFYDSGTFTVPAGIASVEYLVVAGGGGGGSAGGGGAGGLRSGTLAVTPGDKAVVVGAGGAGVIGKGLQGGNSSFDSVSATGGGGGGGNNLASPGNNGGDGGSGGGAGYAPGDTTGTGGAGNAGAYAPAEGTNGGAMVTGSGFAGGGGGGSGGAGTTGAPGTGGNGGNGTASSISGYNTLYAGGGAGSGENGLGVPGSGGGGAAVMGLTGGAGAVNSGGGGGASNLTGGAGGSGIVIVRYPIPAQ